MIKEKLFAKKILKEMTFKQIRKSLPAKGGSTSGRQNITNLMIYWQNLPFILLCDITRVYGGDRIR